MLRIAKGSYRGRRLEVAGRKTRPTSERARAGVFDWLGQRVEDAHVLDLFAGSGALGLEALSRGARAVVFVERARDALAALRRNVSSLGVEAETRVLGMPVERALSRLARESERFELILADPPYSRASTWLGDPGRLRALLAEGGLLVSERDRRSAPLAGGSVLGAVDSRSYGETTFDWLEPDREEGVADATETRRDDEGR